MKNSLAGSRKVLIDASKEGQFGFPCKECDAKFTSYDALLDHRRTHVDKKTLAHTAVTAQMVRDRIEMHAKRLENREKLTRLADRDFENLIEKKMAIERETKLVLKANRKLKKQKSKSSKLEAKHHNNSNDDDEEDEASLAMKKMMGFSKFK